VKKRKICDFRQKEDTQDNVLYKNGRKARKTAVKGNEESKKVRKKF
jgi:hypothetical protein